MIKKHTFLFNSFFIIIFFLFLAEISFSQTADAGLDKEICSDTVSMTANIPTAGFTGRWYVVSGSCTIANINDATTFISNVIVGTTQLRWFVTDGISSDADTVLITNNTPTQAMLNSTDEICISEYTLNGNIHTIEESGLWTRMSGTGLITNPTLYNSDVTGLSLDDNIFKWTISKGSCSSSDSITVINNFIQADAGFDITICQDYYQLQATDPTPGTGSWTTIASAGTPVIESSSVYNSNVISLGAGTNTFKWQVSKGICSDYGIVIITSDKPTTANAGVDFSVCESSAILGANNPVQGTGLWSVVDGNGNFIYPENYNTTVNSLAVGNNTLRWTITKNLCYSSDEVVVNYNYIYVNAGDDAVVCNYEYTMQGNLPSNGTGLWSVVGGAGVFENNTLYNTNLTSILQGENTFEWKITSNGCSSSDYVIITNNSPSIADAGLNQEICGFSTTITAVLPAVGVGFWSVVSGSGTFDNSLANQTIVSDIGLNQNIYRWSISEGSCTNTDDVIITNNYVTSYAGVDQVICGNTTTLDATPPDAGAVGDWTVSSGSGTFANQVYNTSVTDIQFGNNNYIWTISKGICSAEDELVVTNEFYSASGGILGSGDICVDYAQIWANTPPSGAIGYWSMISGSGVFDNSISTNTYVRNLAVGINLISWTINKNSCISSYNFEINRNAVFADAGADQETCIPAATLIANEQLPGVISGWTLLSGGGVIASPESYITDVTGIYPGVNSFRWTVDGNGCSDYDDVNVINNEFLVSAGINKHICTTSTTLSGTNPDPGSGVWTIESGYGVFSSPSYYTTTVSQMESNSVNTFRWTVSKSGCTFYDDVIIYMDMVIADAGVDQTVCYGTAVLNAVEPTSGTGLWSLMAGGGTISDPAVYNTTITGLALGQNTLKWTTNNLGCVSSDEIIIYNNFVNLTAGADIETCYSYATMSADEPDLNGYGVWSVVSGAATFVSPSLNTTQVTDIQRGDNVLMWTVFQNGCDNGGSLVTLTNKSFDANAGVDQVLDYLVTNTTFQAELPISATGIWTVIAGSGNVLDRYSPVSDVIDMPTGINTFKWTVQYNGCSAYDNVNVTVFNFSPYAGSDRTVCENETKLAAMDQSGNPQYWEVIEGAGTFDDITDPGTYVRNIAEGLNTYRWNVTLNGAQAYDEVNIYRAYSYAGEDQNLCVDNTTITGNDIIFDWSGEWVVIGGSSLIEDASINQTNVSNLSSGQNTLRWIVDAGVCVIADDVTINNNIIDAYAGVDQDITAATTQMDAVLPADCSGIWSLIQGYGVMADVNNPYSDLSDLSGGENIFRWTIDHFGCISYDDVIIKFGDSYIDELQAKFGVLIYPNPSDGKFSVNFDKKSEFAEINIFDITGKIIFTNRYYQTKKIDINNIENGIYFININIDDKKATFKIIVNN